MISILLVTEAQPGINLNHGPKTKSSSPLPNCTACMPFQIRLLSNFRFLKIRRIFLSRKSVLRVMVMEVMAKLPKCLNLSYVAGATNLFLFSTCASLLMPNACSQQNISQIFSGFAGNLRAQKPNKAQTKRVNIIYSIFCISTGGVNFFFYPVSSLNFSSSLFSPTYLFSSASVTAVVHPPPPSRAGIIKSNTVSHPTYDRPSLLPIFSTNHRISGDASAVAPSAASDKYLPSPRLRRFVSTTTFDDEFQLRNI